MATEVEREHVEDVAIRYYRLSEHIDDAIAGAFVSFGSIVTGEAQYLASSMSLETCKEETHLNLQVPDRRAAFERVSALIGFTWEQIEDQTERAAIEQAERVLEMFNFDDLYHRINSHTPAELRELRKEACEKANPAIDFGGIYVRLPS